MVDIISVIFALIAICIAYKTSKAQEKLTKQSLKINMYDKRYEIYKRLKDIMQNIIIKGLDTVDVGFELGRIGDEVVFLFDKEIADYVVCIINKYEKLNIYEELIKDNEILEDANKIEYQNLKTYFIEQYYNKGLRNIFISYLDLRNYGLSKNDSDFTDYCLSKNHNS